MSVQDRPLSIPWFTTTTLLQLAALLLGLRFIFPGVWAAELTHGVFVPILVCILIIHTVLGLFEWGFHRWVLHSVLFTWFASFATAHREHHQKTKIASRELDPGPGRVILSEFDMDEPGKFEGSAFPPWSLLGFWIFFSLLLVPLHFLLPTYPVLIGGYAAVVLSYGSYEIIHSIHHYPQTWWEPKLAHPLFGGFWTRVFGFHRMHHYRKRTNMAIGGVLGFWIWDVFFGTYVHPRKLLIQGNIITAEDVTVPDPPYWVLWMDAYVDEHERRFRLSRQRKKQ